ncbi:MAG: phosphate acyltransferase PlsX [Pseudomonadota bacterium]
MSQTQTIALDAMGGDHGPKVVVPAAKMALEQKQDLHFIFVGDQSAIEKELDHYPDLRGVSEVVHTTKMIANHEKPSAALRNSKDSSMRMAIECVKEGRAQSVVSAGNTGALMAISKIILKPLPGISRPAIASIFPTVKGKTVMLDLGANLTCDAEVLMQFSVLGAVYARVVMGIDKPSVGLLNVGTEDQKGHEEVREAATILSQVEFPGRYHGFIEGNDIALGTVNVVVTDGYTGNVALKTAEGVGKMTSQFMRDAFKSSPFAMLGYMLASGAMKRLKTRVDPRTYNGGMFLGLNGVCVKSHGGSDELATMHAILTAADLVDNGFNERVCVEIEQLMNQESFISAAVMS